MRILRRREYPGRSGLDFGGMTLASARKVDFERVQSLLSGGWALKEVGPGYGRWIPDGAFLLFALKGRATVATGEAKSVYSQARRNRWVGAGNAGGKGRSYRRGRAFAPPLRGGIRRAVLSTGCASFACGERRCTRGYSPPPLRGED